MSRHSRRALALAAACLAALPRAAQAQAVTTPPANPIFDPLRAPEIVIRIGVHRLVLVPRQEGSSTISHPKATDSKTDQGFSHYIAATTPGAAAAPSGELHIRGSHGQYTYYLDGAPLPESVSGSFSDLIDPKNIETLRVLTGGFPPQFGENLAAVFDVTAKAGRTGGPAGFAQQLEQGYQTHESTVQFGGGAQRFSYYLSGIRNSTNRRLDPVTQYPLHDAGNDSVVFGKFDYQAGPQDRIILDTARTDSRLQFPNEEDRQALGQNDFQREDGDFANLIWRRNAAPSNLIVALYSHQSRLRYDGDPVHDLLGATPDNPRASAFEDRTANYIGLRSDYSIQAIRQHKIGLGFDLNTVTGNEKFRLDNSDGTNPVQSIVDAHDISGGDRSVYLQDDWTPGRLLVNYGARYDIHKADTTTSQLSPRLNLTYTASGHDKFHAYYDRLFQPAPIEDIRRLDPNAVAFKPERNNFYEVGWQHEQAGITTGVSAYYKTAQDVIDENLLSGTHIREPFNVQKGYVRGIEFAVDGNLARDLSFYANYARSWVQSAGDFTGGLIPQGTPPGYFYADHDQTHTASVGLSYDHHGVSLNLDGEYGSGFPYGQDALGNVNIYRVPVHFIFNLELASQLGRGRLALSADNILNHPYVIKQASPFSDREWGQGRTLGVKWTQSF
ncbi:MAG: TonB-dependent receptor [Armatimonadota bacterium]|nr:TonB-dependent receptor [Armatimonadota bacterium]